MLRPLSHVRRFALAALVLTLTACGSSRREEPAPTIVVPGDVNHEAIHTLERLRGRHPTQEELFDVHRVWIDSEVLYREGLKLQRDAAARANREQTIFAALKVIDEQVRPKSVSDDELQRWFESRREQYAQPARFDYEDASLPGTSSEVAVPALVEQLNRGVALDARASLRSFKSRPTSNLLQTYGAEAAEALARAEPGKWLALRTNEHWRAMRLVLLTPAKPASFDAQREAVRRDFVEATVAEKRSAAVRALWNKYKIEFAESIQCLAEKG